MENTLVNKAKFFALYWNQPVAIITKGSYTHPKGNIHVVDKNTVSSVESENYTKHRYSLELKPLSSISDEDARFLGYSDAKSATTTYFKTLGKNTNDADYLRSRGYALPWMWLSVDQQIEYGWIKLKGETK